MALAVALLGMLANKKYFLPITLSQIWDNVIYPRRKVSQFNISKQKSQV
ncbi:MAG TPA: hypothetical protein GXZ43_08470 [Clostridiaceae bacterium]|nr:hypothetical protein [Clostridiaceae bacterium]